MRLVKTLLIFSALQFVAQAFCLGNQQSPQNRLHSKSSSSCKSTPVTQCQAQVDSSNDDGPKKYEHILAMLTIPYTSIDRIANEAILNTAVEHATNKVSVILRCEGGQSPSLANLRRYVGEVYSTLWDFAMASGDPDFLDVVVYPHNLPNAAPEQWVNHLPDLDCVCSHDSICGWVSESALGRGLEFRDKEGRGIGGLDDHVAALNADRAQRNLDPVTALHVDPWPAGASPELQKTNNVAFLDDEVLENANGINGMVCNGDTAAVDDVSEDGDISSPLLGGVRIPNKSLFEKVAVGGTFDGLHYGHRKLLTLAVSSVNPVSGKLMVGVTVDDMLRKKAFAEHIPSLEERMDGVREFIYRLAPGIKNRVRLEPITDAYGPPGTKKEGAEYDALVLSHETLDNGCKLNQYREETLGLKPLMLLCTRRTETFGMSSTALRRLRSERNQKVKQPANS